MTAPRPGIRTKFKTAEQLEMVRLGPEKVTFLLLATGDGCRIDGINSGRSTENVGRTISLSGRGGRKLILYQLGPDSRLSITCVAFYCQTIEKARGRPMLNTWRSKARRKEL